MENQGDEPFADLRVRRKEEQDCPKTLDQAAHRSGRTSDRQGSRSASQDTDWIQLAKDRFAHGIAEWFYKEAHKGACARNVLVAVPEVLGGLRKALHKEVASRLWPRAPRS